MQLTESTHLREHPADREAEEWAFCIKIYLNGHQFTRARFSRRFSRQHLHLHCCYSVYELLELLSESIPSEDGEETVVLGKRVSQPPVWEVVDTSTCKNGFARFSDKKTHSLTDLQSCSFWCVFVWKHSLASCEDAGNSVFRDKSFLFSETTRPPTDVCTAIALEFEEFGNCGHEFSKRRDSKFADLGARHVAHHYQDFSYAFSDTATSFWVAFEFGCEERVAIRGIVFFQEKTCNCDISRGAEEAVNPRATMEANHRYVAWASGAIFI